MGFFQNVIEQHHKKTEERNAACDELISRIDSALCELNDIFSISHEFIEPNEEKTWKNRNSALLIDTEQQNIKRLKKASQYKILSSKQIELQNSMNALPQRILNHNENVAEMKVQSAYTLIENVEGRKLDQQQMICIVKEAHNHLVIAGAGTGKTTTIVGKIKYLLKTEKYTPKDILVLSFTNASASEMKQRIAAETGENIAASTFHKLGLNILAQSDGVMPRITQINLKKFVKEQLLRNMQSDKYLKMLSLYLLYNHVVAKSEFDFSSQQEYDEYLRMNPPTTFNNETVKSYGEMDIANFFMQNGIRYIYEQPYEVDTRTIEYGQYHPDFYLPDYNIYVEYFGINRQGEVPEYFEGADGMSASEAYRASMEWKRALHNEHKTVMIECYAYEKLEGCLLENLKVKLEMTSVNLTPKSSKELWEQISAKDSSLLDGIIELFETLINLMKSNSYDIPMVRKIIKSSHNAKTNDRIISLLEPIFNAYNLYLTEQKEIDFNDMINMAAEYIRQGKYVNPYKYVIVDEYQDISKARFSLLSCLRESSDFDLFCVGDDWQSIYRFAGSDIGFILNFASYWGPTEISRIETTYRFSQKLIEISGGFIMQNPIQIKKSIKGMTEEIGFPLGEINGYTDKYAIDFLAKKLDDVPNGSSIFFIGRYTIDAKLLSECGIFSLQYNNVTGLIDVIYKKRPNLKITFLTAHKSKGLQADYVFIINNKKSRMGFPSKIQDAPILDLLLENCDQYPHAEERRLFYVALTRAKKKVFIVTVNGKESEFALELKAKYKDDLKREKFECPLCGGQLLKKTGPYGDFFGCSNYHSAGCTYKRKIP